MLGFIEKLSSLYALSLARIKAIQVYDEALALYSAKNYERSLPLMREAAELDHVDAMSIYGSMLLLGYGTKENGKEAEQWLLRAAHTGNSNAIALLGMGYATGRAGFPLDMALGRKYLTEAAEKGDEKSQEMLELMDQRLGIFARNRQAGRSKRH